LRAIATIGLLPLAIVAGLTFHHAQANDPEFKFSIAEDYATYETPTSPSLYFRIFTVELFPCTNYAIPTVVSQGDRHLTVDLGEILEPSRCITAIGHAPGQAELSLAQGHYSITISNHGRIDTYDLDVTASKTSLNSTSTSFTEPSVLTYYRHPVNSFAFYCSGLLFDESVCNGFADRLVTTLSLEPLTFPDDGVWPYKVSLGGYYSPPSQYFTYPDQSTWTEAKGLLDEYVRNLDHTCGRLLELSNWQNDNEMSWLIRPNTEAECQGVVIPTASPSPTPRGSADLSPTPSLTPASLPKTGGAPESLARTPFEVGLTLDVASAIALAAALSFRRHRR
jgi:hypothetical protein